MAEELPVPKVFMSYSHDSSDHKKWVADFSSNLRENGVDVILDQWDLSYGDDLPKFMEQSVTSADRVLMICSEAYVRKADDGTGGVGYEAMIVTGELVNDLGTSKFIPVTRQQGTSRLLPKSVSTRMFINMNDDCEEQFECLLRELHKKPAIKKPALGKNPFAKLPSGEEIPNENSISVELDDASVSTPIETYKTAIDVARSGDIMQWRILTNKARKKTEAGLSSWRSRTIMPESKEALINQSLEGISEFAPLMSMALAGISSGRDKFSNQVSLLEEILHPRSWDRSGLVVVVSLPEAAAFIYQSLHGAMCLYTDQISHAVSLVRAYMEFPNESKSMPLCQKHAVMGWPDSLGHDSRKSWETLESLSDVYPWVNDIFGDNEEYLTALVAYYIILNINEYAFVLKANQEQYIGGGEGRYLLDIPLFFLNVPKEVRRRAYRLVLQNQAEIKDIWRSLGVTDEKFASYWGKWIEFCSSWQSRADYGFGEGVVHSTLLQDLGMAKSS